MANDLTRRATSATRYPCAACEGVGCRHCYHHGFHRSLKDSLRCARICGQRPKERPEEEQNLNEEETVLNKETQTKEQEDAEIVWFGSQDKASRALGISQSYFGMRVRKGEFFKRPHPHPTKVRKHQYGIPASMLAERKNQTPSPESTLMEVAREPLRKIEAQPQTSETKEEEVNQEHVEVEHEQLEEFEELEDDMVWHSTTKDIAAVFGVSSSTITSWARSGRITRRQHPTEYPAHPFQYGYSKSNPPVPDRAASARARLPRKKSPPKTKTKRTTTRPQKKMVSVSPEEYAALKRLEDISRRLVAAHIMKATQQEIDECTTELVLTILEI